MNAQDIAVISTNEHVFICDVYICTRMHIVRWKSSQINRLLNKSD